VFCANASDSVQIAHPTGLGARLKDFKDVKGFAFGEEIMRTAIQNGVARTPGTRSYRSIDAAGLREALRQTAEERCC
jgi:hypothetical protein